MKLKNEDNTIFGEHRSPDIISLNTYFRLRSIFLRLLWKLLVHFYFMGAFPPLELSCSVSSQFRVVARQRVLCSLSPFCFLFFFPSFLSKGKVMEVGPSPFLSFFFFFGVRKRVPSPFFLFVLYVCFLTWHQQSKRRWGIHF